MVRPRCCCRTRRPRACATLRMVAGRAVAAATGRASRPGTPQLPLPRAPGARPPDARRSAPVDGPATVRAALVPAPELPAGRPWWRDDLFDRAERGVIVCGPQDDPAWRRQVTSVAELVRWPVLADPLSQVRCGEHHNATVLGAYDSFLRDRPTRRACARTSSCASGRRRSRSRSHATCSATRRPRRSSCRRTRSWRDPDQSAADGDHGRRHRPVLGPAREVTKRLEARRRCRATASRGWPRGSRPSATTVAIDASAFGGEASMSEGGVFWHLARRPARGATVFAGNSMPVRDLDTFFGASTKPRELPRQPRRQRHRRRRVVGARCGREVAGARRAGDRRPLVLPRHERPARRQALRASTLTIVLVNNDGGGIFSLPAAERRSGRTSRPSSAHPHGLDFAPAAAALRPRLRARDDALRVRDRAASVVRPPGRLDHRGADDAHREPEAHRGLWRDVAAVLDRPMDADHAPGYTNSPSEAR